VGLEMGLMSCEEERACSHREEFQVPKCTIRSALRGSQFVNLISYEKFHFRRSKYVICDVQRNGYEVESDGSELFLLALCSLQQRSSLDM
jgi:hypothetical protein